MPTDDQEQKALVRTGICPTCGMPEAYKDEIERLKSHIKNNATKSDRGWMELNDELTATVKRRDAEIERLRNHADSILSTRIEIRKERDRYKAAIEGAIGMIDNYDGEPLSVIYEVLEEAL